MDRIVCSYIDTDSLHIRGEDYKKLKLEGYIDETKLGYLSNDCKKNGLIIQELNIAPKCYMYRCLCEDGEILTVMKCKGIVQKKLKEELFLNLENLTDEEKEVQWNGLRKINKKQTKEDKENEFPLLSIQKKKYTRTFCKNEWNGMIFDDNNWYPIGYHP